MQVINKWQEFRNSSRYEDRKGAMVKRTKGTLMTILQIILIVGIAYVILSPVIGIVSRSFYSNTDLGNPMVFTIPMNPTMERYQVAWTELDYFPTLASTLIYTVGNTLLQVFICSMVGYGFARFDFPFKKLLFGCVVLMIVIPSHTIMIPLYMTFRSMDLMGSAIPMYLLSLFGVGLRSGLFIYIFNQFFRGLPKEIEEAAFVDGAGTAYTYFFIMLVNAMPAVITVAVFSLVWQYNDMFYGNLFQIPKGDLLGRRLMTLQSNISSSTGEKTPAILRLYVNAGVVLVMMPILIIYLVLQKRFVEGVERSGIVG